MKILWVALAYAAAAKVGLSLAVVHPSATPVWPPTGIALAAFLIYGRTIWPGVFLGAFLANLTTPATVFVSLGIAVGNTLESAAGAYLIRRFANGRNVFDHPYTVVQYIALAALASTMISATLGVTVLVLTGSAAASQAPSIWLTWWLGDVGGALIVAPLILLWRSAPAVRWDSQKRIEGGLLFITLLLSGGMAFWGLFQPKSGNYPLEFLCIPVVIWSAFRFGRRETALVTFLLSLIAIGGTWSGHGPFVQASPNTSMLLLQAYMGMVAMTGLLVASVVLERQRNADAALRQSEKRYQRLLESNIIGFMIVDEKGRVLDANEALLHMLDYTREDLQAGMMGKALTPPEYQIVDEWMRAKLSETGYCPAVEKEYVRKDGSRAPVLVGVVAPDDSTQHLVCFVIDVTDRRNAMQALRKAYDEMETRVMQRTTELADANQELTREIERRKRAEAELRNLSLLDPLTGLYNRRGFLALAEQQWLQAVRNKKDFLFFFVDVDGLKAINDSLGHARGDQVLLETAEALRRTFRQSDILARVGGDEFAILAPQLPMDQAQGFIGRLQNQLDELNATKQLPFKLSLSTGVASFDQQRSTTIQEMMRRADEDLYKRRRILRDSASNA